MFVSSFTASLGLMKKKLNIFPQSLIIQSSQQYYNLTFIYVVFYPSLTLRNNQQTISIDEEPHK